MRRWRFSKGHGTQNDFVVLLDRENVLDPSDEDVRWLCDRRAGIGGDGLLRAVMARHVPEWDGDPGLWFMDYRNADGSVAQMCGNGVRVFVRYLLDQGLATGPTVDVATRAGLKPATALPDGRVRVGMGRVAVAPGTVRVTTAGGSAYDATSVDVGNPHAVSVVTGVGSLDLTREPRWEPAEAFGEGVNLEFVEPLGERHVAMRVHERGVGETRSCGTGTVAAAAAARALGVGGASGGDGVWTVDVPGGRVEVELVGDEAHLTGPAVLVAHGEVTLPPR
ncbi:diaminopimelate epimerase [Microlunatus sagamiharensis]|uniref:Diaminopimelate epimerase n=1 Tax=Microlunatus sagamiharensis TaxID=546874 RepID=A0A1H2LYL9_9ACTN|nr:diaminopimelate epimerase [Microlunatus sagamiharensis]SDU85974.1 diaminopimelate epimerase [Microlunatus sagamiharensis]